MTVQRCVVTGAAGNIAYSLIFQIASGGLFGSDEVDLRLLDIPEFEGQLKGLEYEIQDCGFYKLKRIQVTSDPYQAFEGANSALLVGAKPRSAGMERRDLLEANAQIFTQQGKVINTVADKKIKVLVVGNPCNTNCLIAQSWALDLPEATFCSMTRLDQIRAESYVARKKSIELKDAAGVVIWGNHSTSQVVDPTHLMTKYLCSREFIEEDLMPFVQKRGAEVIKARGKSSAASAANAALVAMKDLITTSGAGYFYSSGISSKKNPFGIREDLVFSFPCMTNASGAIQVHSEIKPPSWLESYLRKTESELVEERDAVRHLLGPNY